MCFIFTSVFVFSVSKLSRQTFLYLFILGILFEAFPKIYFVCLSVFLQHTCGIVNFLFSFYHKPFSFVNSFAYLFIIDIIHVSYIQFYVLFEQPLTTYICVQSEQDIIWLYMAHYSVITLLITRNITDCSLSNF